MARTDADRRRRQSLEDTHPDASDYWIAPANYPETPGSVTAKSRRVFWWSCKSGHEFRAAVHAVAAADGTISTYQCAECRVAQQAEWKRLTALRLEDLPEIVAAWRDEQPYFGRTLGDRGLWKFRCPNGHNPRMSAFRYYTEGCQHCRATKAAPLTETFPELASQWHPTRNRLAPDKVGAASRRAIWWITPCCGHEWQESPRDRILQPALRCPVCRTILRSLAARDPDLAAQWHPANPMSASHVKPFSSEKVRWICPSDPSHEWEAQVMARSSGIGCPICSTAGTSAAEKELAQAMGTHLPGTKQGARVARTSAGPAWQVDVLADVDQTPIVVEYDGEYWHRHKAELDVTKTVDLIASGHLVVRIRENDLPDLPFEHPKLLQLRHRPRFEAIAPLAAQILGWARSAASTSRH